MKNYKKLKKYILDPLFLFRLSTAMKITLIPALSFFIVAGIMWLFVHMNLIFFEANGFLELGSLRDAYYDYIYGNLTGYYKWGLIYLAFLFFLGNYIAGLMLRPFKALSDYCEKAQADFNTFEIARRGINYQPSKCQNILQKFVDLALKKHIFFIFSYF